MPSYRPSHHKNSSRRAKPASAATGHAGDVDADGGFASRDSSRGRRAGGGRWQQLQQAGGVSKRSSSLFGFLDYTSTSCGARLLRTNLLQPLTDINTLQLRLDSLQVSGVTLSNWHDVNYAEQAPLSRLLWRRAMCGTLHGLDSKSG